MNDPILVTGASGTLGGEVVRQLLEKGRHLRLALRKPENYHTSSGRVELVRFDYHDPRSFVPALAGVAAVFVVLPPLDPEAPQLFAPFLRAAQQVGIRRLILTSAIGVEQDEAAPLRQVERQIEASGIDHTFLRPNFFMENFSSGFLAPMIRETGGVPLPAEEGKTSFVSVVDIAAVAVAALTGAGHIGKAYTLTGPQGLNHAEAAALISAAGSRQVTYHPIDDATMRRQARENGLPEPAVEYLSALYRLVGEGHVAGVTRDVRAVLGREPIDFTAFAQANEAVWRSR